MSKIDEAIRSEITRLTRKELRSQVMPLQKQVRDLSRQVRKLLNEQQKISRTTHKLKEAHIETVSQLTVPEEEMLHARISPGLIRKLRLKQNLTQQQLAALVGVSPAAVQSWEQGIARPAGENKMALIALRKLGRREIADLLATKGVEPAKRKPRAQPKPEDEADTALAKTAGKSAKKTAKKTAKKGKKAKKSKRS